MRDMAGPEKMPWVRIAYTLVAPADISLETWEGEKESLLQFIAHSSHYMESGVHMYVNS